MKNEQMKMISGKDLEGEDEAAQRQVGRPAERVHRLGEPAEQEFRAFVRVRHRPGDGEGDPLQRELPGLPGENEERERDLKGEARHDRVPPDPSPVLREQDRYAEQHRDPRQAGPSLQDCPLNPPKDCFSET